MMKVEERLTASEMRNYLQRLEEMLKKEGIESIFKIIDKSHLQRFFICEDWKNTDMSRDRIAIFHRYYKKTNFCSMCGQKNGHSKKKT